MEKIALSLEEYKEWLKNGRVTQIWRGKDGAPLIQCTDGTKRLVFASFATVEQLYREVTQ